MKNKINPLEKYHNYGCYNQKYLHYILKKEYNSTDIENIYKGKKYPSDSFLKEFSILCDKDYKIIQDDFHNFFQSAKEDETEHKEPGSE